MPIAVVDHPELDRIAVVQALGLDGDRAVAGELDGVG